jgi:hypothetical protein
MQVPLVELACAPEERTDAAARLPLICWQRTTISLDTLLSTSARWLIGTRSLL